MTQSYIAPVELEKAYRLLNHGPTVLVSAQHGDDRNVMAAAWACALEFKPAKVSVVLDKSTKTRQLVEQSGYFTLQVPCYAQLDLTHQLGTISKLDDPENLSIAVLSYSIKKALPARLYQVALHGLSVNLFQNHIISQLMIYLLVLL